MKYFPLLYSGIFRNFLRALLLGLQISVAFVLFGLLQGMKAGWDKAIDSVDANMLMVSGKFSPLLPISFEDQLQRIPGVEMVTNLSGVDLAYQNSTQRVPAIATSIRSLSRLDPDLVVSPQTVSALATLRTGIIVGETLAKRYGWKLGDHIPLSPPANSGRAMAWEFDVVGFARGSKHVPEKADQVFINLSYYDQLRPTDKGMVESYMVRTIPGQAAEEVADEIDQLYVNSAYQTWSRSFKERAQRQMQRIGNLSFVVHIIATAVLCALFVSVGASLIKSIQDRTHDLAIMLALGFTPVGIASLIAAETTLLWVTFALLGLIFADLTFPYVVKLLNFYIDMPPLVILWGALLAAGMAIFCALVPVWRALNLQIATALAER
jgi:putative ABC transport system permease protein